MNIHVLYKFFSYFVMLFCMIYIFQRNFVHSLVSSDYSIHSSFQKVLFFWDFQLNRLIVREKKTSACVVFLNSSFTLLFLSTLFLIFLSTLFFYRKPLSKVLPGGFQPLLGSNCALWEFPGDIRGIGMYATSFC